MRMAGPVPAKPCVERAERGGSGGGIELEPQKHGGGRDLHLREVVAD